MKAKKIYRMCLLLILLAAIGSSIWYAYHLYEKKSTPDDGILVEAEFELHNEA